MTIDLKDRIKNFLVGWDNISMNEIGLADYDLWVNEAISLLTETLENN